MEYKELKWSNPIAEEIYQAEANRKFLKSCLNELSIVFEPAFVLAAGALGGFIRTSFTFPEELQANLGYPHDDLQLSLRLLYLYQRKGDKWFRKFINEWCFDRSAFDEALNIAKSLSTPFLAERNQEKQIGHLNDFKFNAWVSRIQRYFAEAMLKENIAIYTELELASPLSADIYYNPSNKVYFKVSNSSIINYIQGLKHKQLLVFFELNQLCGAKTEETSILKAAITHSVKFLSIVPFSLHPQIISFTKLVNEKNEFVVGPLLATRLMKLDINKLRTIDGIWAYFYNYNSSMCRLAAICPRDDIDLINEFIRSQVNNLSEELKDKEVHNMFIRMRQVKVVLGAGLLILEINGPKVQSTKKDEEDSEEADTRNGMCFNFLQGQENLIKNGNCSLEKLNIVKQNGETSNALLIDACSVCLCDATSYVRNSICGHLICDNCLFNCLDAKSPNSFPIRCMIHRCRCLMLLSDIDKMLSRRYKNQVELHLFLNSIMERWLDRYLCFNNIGYRACQSEECGVIFKAYQSEIERESNTQRGLELTMEQLQRTSGVVAKSAERKIFCTGCQSDRCTECGHPFHSGVTCLQYFLSNVLSDSMKEWKSQEPLKRRFCPNVNCHMPVEKDEGCNHVTCEKCGIEFCWLCEDYKAETTSAIYEHLQKSHEYNVLFDLPDPNNDFNVQALGDY